ncbi:MAG TPA: SPFH domain-containing protein, partial [Pseudomonadales bacterium]|nr:SPFH domain-containing protein [Pseudomonadales bacterium]
MNSRIASVFGLLLLLFILLSSCLFTVKQTERAVRLLVGKVVDTDLQPGLYFKFPFIYEVRKFDGRIILLDMNAAEYLTQEKKRLVVDSFVTWRVANVERYYTSTGGGDPSAANMLLAPRVNEGLRNQFGERTVHEVVSGEREKL